MCVALKEINYYLVKREIEIYMLCGLFVLAEGISINIFDRVVYINNLNKIIYGKVNRDSYILWTYENPVFSASAHSKWALSKMVYSKSQWLLYWQMLLLHW